MIVRGSDQDKQIPQIKKYSSDKMYEELKGISEGMGSVPFELFVPFRGLTLLICGICVTCGLMAQPVPARALLTASM